MYRAKVLKEDLGLKLAMKILFPSDLEARLVYKHQRLAECARANPA